MNLLDNFRIPTILGLFVLVAGLFAGVYLSSVNQNLNSSAAPNEQPKNILITNIEDQSVSISWQTDSPQPGFVTFGVSSPTQTVIDDRDTDSPIQRSTHHVTLLNLTPITSYQFKVVSGKASSSTQQFTTAANSNPNGFKPVIGTVLNGSTPASGIVFLQVNGVITASAPIKNLGNFVISITNLRKQDLSAIFMPSVGTSAKLVVFTEDEKKASATINLNNSDKPVGVLKVGQDLDLTNPTLGISTEEKNAFDTLAKKIRNK